ncbi:MAG: type II secretion system F family protein [Chloroflexi bacterium]|nr:type II secretion system F family protein [Chloroflexota bacterium]
MARVINAPAKEKRTASYRYLATNAQGKTVKGSINATGEIEAERLLIDKGLRPLNVELVPSMFTLEEALPSLFQVKPRDVIIFSRQLATLLKSGISLLPALEILGGQTAGSRVFKKMIQSMVSDLRAGGSFTDSLNKHPTAFNELYCRTIAVGEQTGNLEAVLNQMAAYLEKQGATLQKVRKALSYPMLLLGVGVVVVIILMTVVMPQLMGMFTSLGVKLPLPTRILISISTFISTEPLYLLIGSLLLGTTAFWLVKQPSGRKLLDRLLITAPLIGTPMLLGELGRFARTTSVLVTAGLSLQEIMELAPQTTTNSVIRNALNQVNERLILGEGLAEPMSRIDIFPPLLVQMVVVGEESNSLGFTMGVVADFYETTAEERMNAMVAVIGPLSTIGIALMVGFIAISVLMPIYSIAGAFG